MFETFRWSAFRGSIQIGYIMKSRISYVENFEYERRPTARWCIFFYAADRQSAEFGCCHLSLQITCQEMVGNLAALGMRMSQPVSFLRVRKGRFLAFENHTIISAIQGKGRVGMHIFVTFGATTGSCYRNEESLSLGDLPGAQNVCPGAGL